VKLKVSQRSGEFFELFAESARNLRLGAEQLRDLVADYTNVELKARQIQDREHDGDEVTHTIIRRLNTTFITPIDREDIYALASALDDVMDLIEETADIFVLHAIEAPLPEMKAQADVLVLAAVQTEQAVLSLAKMDRDRLEPYWVEINRLENDGDRAYRRILATLFSGKYEALEVLKLKDVVDSLEDAIDGFESVANIVEQIAVKES
jgi:uncharacterized protein